MSANTQTRSPLVVAIAAVFACACFSAAPYPSLTVRIVKPSTPAASPDAMAGVTWLRVRLLDEGRTVVEKRLATDSGSVDFEGVPAGAPLTVKVAGFASATPDGELLVVGQSAPVAVGATAVTVTVVVRPVERFSPAVLSGDTGAVARMSRPRAGHTATVLDDGRVLLVGGFDTTGLSAANAKDPLHWSYTETAEIFDPATGTLTAAPPMLGRAGPVRRAFHTASKLASNQVLIAGGEFARRSGPTLEMATAFDGTMMFDPSIADDVVGGWVTQPSSVERSDHVAIADASGMVLVYGGLFWEAGTPTFGPSGRYLDQWYDPNINAFTNPDPALSSSTFTAFGHSGLAVLDSKYVAIAGGSQLDVANSGKPNRDRAVRFYQYNSRDSRFLEQATVALATPRSFLSFAGAPTATRYLLIGGFTSFDASRWWDRLPAGPYAGSDILDLKGGTPSLIPGPTMDVARGHACSVPLHDGRILVIGGRGGTPMGSLANTGVFTDSQDSDARLAFSFAKGGDLSEARYFHTCTLLQDGSVLVAGGVQEQGAELRTLSSMEIFVPRPLAQ